MKRGSCLFFVYMLNYYRSCTSTSVVITLNQPFENERTEEEFYLVIRKTLAEGGRKWISREKQQKNLDDKKSLMVRLSEKKLLFFEENSRTLSPSYAYSISDIQDINTILKMCLYTREPLVYNALTGKLTKKSLIEA